MKKEEAIRIITSCAREYHKQLENKNLLFIFGSAQKVENFEAAFLPKNFLHLTGAELPLDTFSGSSDFYEKCLKGQLRPNDFHFAANGTTEMKLQILPQLMQIQKVAKMVGDFNFTKSMLVTEKLAGNVTACMGFIRDDNFYIPNTALKEDIRDITQHPQQRVLAIYKKNGSEPLYSQLTYSAKGIDLNNLLQLADVFNKISLSDGLSEELIQSPKLEKEHVVYNHILMNQASENNLQKPRLKRKLHEPER